MSILRSKQLVLLLALTASIVYTVDGINDTRAAAELNETVLRLLVYGPYPNPEDVAWDGGIALISAVRLAFNQINNHSRILQGYRLEAVEDDSGCQIETTAVSSVLNQIYYSDQKIIGTIGPGCSKSTLLLAPSLSRPEISLVQIAPSATSPEIERKNASTTFTMRAPMGMIYNTVDLLKKMEWKRCATLYDQERAIHTQLHDAFVDMTNETDIKVNFTSSIVDEEDDQFFPIEALRRKMLRVIVVFAEPVTTQKIMCLAYKRSMTYPTYQWILVEKSLNEISHVLGEFVVRGEKYSCSVDEMRIAFNNSIITQYSLTSTNDTVITPLNITYAEYREQYLREFHQHLNESRIQELISDVNKSESDFIREDYWENLYYDAAWAFALALDRVVKGGTNLSDYQHGQENVTAVILKEIHNVAFQGSSGFINFTQARNVLSSILTKQVVNTMHTVPVCSRNQSTFNCSESFDPIDDSFGEKVQRVHVAVGVLIILTAVVLAVFTACLHVLFVVFADWKSVKATSPDISHLIFSGCYLYCLATILYILQQTIHFDDKVMSRIIYSVLCNSVVWCIITGASLIFGTMLVKVWRIFKLFRHFRNKRPGIFLSDRALILAVLGLVAVDLVLCVCWNYIDPNVFAKVPLHDFVFDVENGNTEIKVNLQCQCENISVWIGLVIGLKGPIVILLVVFATLNRKINRKHFSHTRKVNILVYSMTVTCGAGFSLFIILDSLNVSVYTSVIFCIVTLVPVTLCCLLLFIPPILQLSSEPLSPSRSRGSRTTGSRSHVYH